jgi:hypothetical protein
MLSRRIVNRILLNSGRNGGTVAEEVTWWAADLGKRWLLDWAFGTLRGMRAGPWC